MRQISAKHTDVREPSADGAKAKNSSPKKDIKSKNEEEASPTQVHQPCYGYVYLYTDI